MYWMAPENFIFILGIILTIVGLIIGNTLLSLIGAAILIGLIIFSVVGMVKRRNENKRTDQDKL